MHFDSEAVQCPSLSEDYELLTYVGVFYSYPKKLHWGSEDGDHVLNKS